MNGTKFVNGQQVKAKKAAAPSKEPKAKAKPTERKETVYGVICRMLIERKHTDDEIVAEIEKKFPGRKHPVSTDRGILNAKDEFKKNPLVRLMRDPSGKLVPWQPKAKTAKTKIAGTAADPLVKAGVIKKEKSATPTKS